MVPQPSDASEQAAMAEYLLALIVATIGRAGEVVKLVLLDEGKVQLGRFGLECLGCVMGLWKNRQAQKPVGLDLFGVINV